MPVSIEKRASPRISQRRNLTIASGDGRNHRDGQMHNYNEDGLFFVSSEAYSPGNQLQLTMDTYDPEAQGPESFKSYVVEVKSCKKLESDGETRFGVGVCYVYKSKEDIPRLTPGRQNNVTADALRQKAEQFLADRADTIPDAAGADTRQILHELQVHQIELEMQNDELRRAQSETETALAKYTDLYDFAPVSYFTMDSKGLIQKVNLTGTALLGFARQHLIGRPLGYFVAQEDKDSFWRHRQSVINSRTCQSIELKLNRKDGAQVFVCLESRLIPQVEQDKNDIFSAVIDITERKRAEETYRRLEEHLNEAKKMEAIGTLAGGVAHDFNNLLMGVQGYVSLMREDPGMTQPYAGYLRSINAMLSSAAELTKQLLGFAQGGKYDVRPINIKTSILNSSDLFRRTRKDVHVITDLQEDVWAVEADRSQIEQVLLNLFINAGDAMPDGGRLRIHAANFALEENRDAPAQLPPGNYVQITVSDTGSGMDQATRERIFEPFYTTKRVRQGAGLGLASVYGIIRNHKGSIQVFSEPSKGSTFIVLLPATTHKISDISCLPWEIRAGTETVLFVDDEPHVRDVGVIMLKRLGYRVLLAENGKRAIEQFSLNRDQIDLVILDMTMPGMSGSETYDQLRTLDPGVKVLLASGYSRNGDAQEILNRGCKAFIQKPYTLKQFSQELRQILDTN